MIYSTQAKGQRLKQQLALRWAVLIGRTQSGEKVRASLGSRAGACIYFKGTAVTGHSITINAMAGSSRTSLSADIFIENRINVDVEGNTRERLARRYRRRRHIAATCCD